MTDPRREKRNAISWELRLSKTDRGIVKPTVHNAALHLEHLPDLRGLFALNELTARIEYRHQAPWPTTRTEIGENDITRARSYLSEVARVDYTADTLLAAVAVVAEDARFHPVRDYLESLTFDPEHAVLDGWLTTFCGARADNAKMQAYLRRVGPLFAIGAVARIFEPGCKVDHLPIFEGRQGLGKSRMLATLGGEWFSDTPFVMGDKDAYQALQGVWIYEMAELDSLNKAEATKVKAFIAAQVDRYRPSYGRTVEAFPRQCVFAGTTNQHEYLKDSSGHRRFWPVLCEKIDQRGIEEYRDAFWAEAVHRYRAGEPWWPAAAEHALFDRVQRSREIDDPFVYYIRPYLVARKNHGATQVTTREIIDECLEIDGGKLDMFATNTRIGRIMASLGLQKRRRTTRKARSTLGEHYYDLDAWEPGEHDDDDAEAARDA